MSAITIVVATRNRKDDLLRSLPRHEAPVLLVDNGSTDDSVAAVRAAFPRLEIIELPRNVGAVARNIGVQRARTPLVAFADDDSWWAPGALARAAEAFLAHPRLAVLAGRVLVGPAERLDPLSAAMAAAPLGRHPDGAGPDVLGFAACGAVVRRSAFLQVGGFDPVVRFPGEEERVALDLAERGWQLSYVEDVVAHHHPSARRDATDARQRRIVRSALLTACMRRPWPTVLDRARADWRAGGARRAGVRASIPSLPAALLRRRPVSRATEDKLRLLAEQARTGTPPAGLRPVGSPEPEGGGSLLATGGVEEAR
jgi:GT2 family glycosyltransferase